MEVFTNLVLNSVGEQTNWLSAFSKHNCTGSEKDSLTCRALNIALQEVIPELIPVSSDDIWIQILIVIIILLLYDRFTERISDRD